MKKFFFAAAFALAFCVTGARAACFQSDGVRVGPAAEEKAADAAAAPAPKKGDKNGRPADDPKGERKEGAAKKSSERRDGERAEGERVSEKSQTPSTVSTAAAPPTGAVGTSPATSDAPPKPAAPAPVPVNTPASSSPSEPNAAGNSRTYSTTATPNGRRVEAPAPQPTAIGIAPISAAIVVIMIGRKRTLAASRIASEGDRLPAR